MSSAEPVTAPIGVPVPAIATVRELFLFRVLREGLAGVPAQESWSALSHPRTGPWTMRQMLERTVAAAPLMNLEVDPATLAVSLQVETVHDLPVAWLDFAPPHAAGQVAKTLVVWPSALPAAGEKGITTPWLLTFGAEGGSIVLWGVTDVHQEGQVLGEIPPTMTRGQVVGMVRRTINAFLTGVAE